MGTTGKALLGVRFSQFDVDLKRALQLRCLVIRA
jgi:hypothetical protein